MPRAWGSPMSVEAPGEGSAGSISCGCAYRHPRCPRSAELELSLLDPACGAWVSVAVCAQHATRTTDDPSFAHWSEICETPDHVAHDMTVRPLARVTA